MHNRRVEGSVYCAVLGSEHGLWSDKSEDILHSITKKLTVIYI